MSAPTFVAEYETTWTASAVLSVNVTVAAGDFLVIYGGLHNGGGILAVPSGGGLTYTEHQVSNPGSSYCTSQIWSAPCPSSGTFSITTTATATTSSLRGINVLRFSGASGAGASAKSNASGAAPSLSLTTTGDNSAVVMFNTDWNGVSGARTFRPGAGTFTEQSYYQAGTWMLSGGFYADAGAAGAKTIGLSAPTGQKYALVALEVLGASSTPPPAATTHYGISGGALVPLTLSPL